MKSLPDLHSELVDQALVSGRDSASLLASTVDSSVDAILGKTLDGLITSWNLGAEQMYGYEASEVIGRHISLLFPPDALDDLDEALERIAHGGLVEQHDTQRVCKDGTVFDVSVTIAPIHDESGVITGASAIGRDITRRMALERERKLLDTRLNQSERFESMGRLAGAIAYDFNNPSSEVFSTGRAEMVGFGVGRMNLVHDWRGSHAVVGCSGRPLYFALTGRTVR